MSRPGSIVHPLVIACAIALSSAAAAADTTGTHFSDLAQVTTANVRQLKPAFTFDVGVQRGQQAAPLVVGDTMYIVTPFPNYLYALDLRHNGRRKWAFEPQPDVSAEGAACCDAGTAGIAHDDGRVFMVTLDGQAIAIDAASGKQQWRTKLADVAKGETVTVAPLVVRGKLLVGNSGAEFGVRGWLAALDTATGKEAWRAWSTGPDAEVLIGADFRPYYETERGRNLGVASWPLDGWKTGGGNASGPVSYDPEADLVYYGTASPAPRNPEQRAGDNKWTAGIFARKPDHGAARWFYQWNPHDLHGYDGTGENILVDLAVGGRARKVLLHPDSNGYLYVLDRLTGQVLSADPYVDANTIRRVDPVTGRPVSNPGKDLRVGEPTRHVCPGSAGAKGPQSSSWSPRTGLLYIPHQHLCEDVSPYDVAYIAGTPRYGVDSEMFAAPNRSRGALTAWDPLARKARWSIAERFPVMSGALATAGGVVFYGTMDGWFKAVNAADGKPLWQYRVASGIVGQPVAYQGPDGRQYVAVLAGVGGWAGAIVSNDLDARDGTAARGYVNAMQDLPSFTRKGGRLYVFAL
jgi:PQQ-dependent dehydrogenase (methanol/ethanol family)